MTYAVPAALHDPKPAMVDCTDQPDVIAASLTAAFGSPRGGWYGGRFFAYSNSLREWRGEKREINV